jgi:guanosine-3',5'-bis(diphosphate) 3'-pyrophosphohydrolase
MAEARSVDPLLKAIAFAARAHHGQMRKDGSTPYVSHVVRVSYVLRQLFGVDDQQALIAAILHDTIEDTTSDFDDLEEEFGDEVADWVARLTKDKRLPDHQRESAYIATLADSPWQVKVCKLADVYDNLADSVNLPAGKKSNVFTRAHAYLDGLKHDLPEQARVPWQIVSNLLSKRESGDGDRAGGA